jgi:hypothetical protein
MADKKISELTELTTPDGTEELVVNDSGVSKKVQIDNLIADNGLSGDKIDGGTISNFTSTGIDDNATSTAITIDASENVGIGTSSTFGKASINSNGAPATSGNMSTGLTVHNTSGGTAINIGTYDAGGYSYIQSAYVNSAGTTRDLAFLTGATERMRIDSAGDVGIGTTTPAAKLEVYESIRPALRLNGNGNNAVGTEYGAIEFYNRDPSGIGASVQASMVVESTQSTGAGADIMIGSSDGSYALSEKLRILSSGGITFNGDTAAANALDDYEEGTWTPTVSSGITSITYGTNTGTYTKVGNLVTFECILELTAGTLDAGDLKFGGMPFNAVGTLSAALFGLSANVGLANSCLPVMRILSIDIRCYVSGSGTTYKGTDLTSGLINLRLAGSYTV